MKKQFKLIATFALLLGLFGCSKDDGLRSFPFTIMVTTPEGIPVQNARVEANAPVPASVLMADFVGFTDEFGMVSFEYNYEAVLKIQATRSAGQLPSWIGCGFVKLEEDKETVARIIIRPFNPDIGGC
jgi:hypothetical protein